MQVKQLDKANEARWDAFVAGRPEGTFFHLSGLRRVIERGFRRQSYYLYAEDGGEIVGVLPLVHVPSRLFGRALVSTGFYVYGGPIGATSAAHAALDEAAIDLAKNLKVEYLEYRNRQPLRPDWPRQDNLYATFRKPIDPDPDVNMKAIPRKQRAMVRKGQKFGLSVTVDRDVDRFFAIYSESVRNLGTPVFPKAIFTALTEEFGENCDILTISHDGAAVASVVSFYFRDEVLPYYGGSIASARPLAANDFMYWSLMEHARARGARLFDFGRSKVGTGAYAFKKFWGFEPEPLHYEFRLFAAEDLPEINPLNPKYKLMIETWKRMPLPLANTLGPLISRSLA